MMDPERRASESDEEKASFLPQARLPSNEHDDETRISSLKRRPVSWYLRIGLEVVMAMTIIGLVFWRPEKDCTARIRKTPVPNFPKKLYTFKNDPHYAHEDMFFDEDATLHTLHNWLPLSTSSRGYIRFPPSIQSNPTFDLPKPHNLSLDIHTYGPGYMLSTFHQLHCLSYLASHLQSGFSGTPLTKEVSHHSAHCLNYIRQGIMCAGDMTLEGETEEGPGEGSVHECVDWERVQEWAEERKAGDWRNGLLPDTAIL